MERGRERHKEIGRKGEEKRGTGRKLLRERERERERETER